MDVFVSSDFLGVEFPCPFFSTIVLKPNTGSVFPGLLEVS